MERINGVFWFQTTSCITLFAISENILDINNEIIKNIKTKNFEIFNNRGKALRLAIKSLMKDDILVVLGKGREDFQEVKGEKIDYSDIKIIESFIE